MLQGNPRPWKLQVRAEMANLPAAVKVKPEKVADKSGKANAIMERLEAGIRKMNVEVAWVRKTRKKER